MGPVTRPRRASWCLRGLGAALVFGLRPSAPASVARQRDALQADGVIRLTEAEMVLLKDHLFTSPSTAGGVIVGGSNNGRISWRNADGQSINDLEAIALASTASGSNPS